MIRIILTTANTLHLSIHVDKTDEAKKITAWMKKHKINFLETSIPYNSSEITDIKDIQKFIRRIKISTTFASANKSFIVFGRQGAIVTTVGELKNEIKTWMNINNKKAELSQHRQDDFSTKTTRQISFWKKNKLLSLAQTERQPLLPCDENSKLENSSYFTFGKEQK